MYRLSSLLVWILIVLCPVVYGQANRDWQIETVDSGANAGAFTSLAIDRFGDFHLAYSNRSGTLLRYAFRPKGGKEWAKTTVDPLGGSFETLAVDSHGWAHIAYVCAKSAGLHYAFWNGTQWRTYLIDPGKINRQTSIQLDSHDSPRIGYYREEYEHHEAAASLKYAYLDGKTWYTQTVDHRPGTGMWNSLALDRNDHPYLAYSIAEGSLAFAYFDQSTWEHTTAGSTKPKVRTAGDTESSLQLDNAGIPHVAYIDATTRSVTYAWKEGGVWHQEVIDSLTAIGGTGGQIDLKLDKNLQPHVVYYDSGRSTLKYATRKDGQWRVEMIESGGGQYASLCLDENGQPYVSYYSADSELKVAHRSESSEKPSSEKPQP